MPQHSAFDSKSSKKTDMKWFALIPTEVDEQDNRDTYNVVGITMLNTLHYKYDNKQQQSIDLNVSKKDFFYHTLFIR